MKTILHTCARRWRDTTSCSTRQSLANRPVVAIIRLSSARTITCAELRPRRVPHAPVSTLASNCRAHGRPSMRRDVSCIGERQSRRGLKSLQVICRLRRRHVASFKHDVQQEAPPQSSPGYEKAKEHDCRWHRVGRRPSTSPTPVTYGISKLFGASAASRRSMSRLSEDSPICGIR